MKPNSQITERDIEAEIARLEAQLEQEKRYRRAELQPDQRIANLVGTSSALQNVRNAISQVAPTDSTALIFGETGTGKELIAGAIHELSRRREHLFVKVNCAALASGVLASELFGHEAGAFTGATKQRKGRFELAQHGTILLDEITEVPAQTQVMLLRVLQERIIERVGGSEPIAIDVRVITATNRDMEAAVRDGSFRDDLYYRLNVFPIRVPPLRERVDDIPLLARYFLVRFRRRMNKRVEHISAKTMQHLQGYHWPGNVRELENLIERAMIVTTGNTLEFDPHWLTSTDSKRTKFGTLAEIEREAILDALQSCDGKIYGPDGAANMLGVKPTTLYGKMRKHSIARPDA